MLDRLKKDQKTTTAPVGVVIAPPHLQASKFHIRGTAPYMQNKMSSANRQAMIAKQEAGEQAKKNKKRSPKDFNAVYQGAMHYSTEGWHGIPSSSFRAALISACRLAGFVMTRAKLSLFIIADGRDRDTSEPLTKITKGKPHRVDMAVRLADGSTDISARPVWDEWETIVTIQWDADQFSAEDVTNLLMRVGLQVGIGAGRHDSRQSAGIGFGTFEVLR